MPRQRRRKRGPAVYQGPRRARPPFPINLIFNVKAFYFFFIVVMIASMGAVGLGGTFGSSPSSRPPPVEEELQPEETPAVLSFDGPAPVLDATKPYVAVLQTNKGPIEIRLATDAPDFVNSFAFLAGKGFYDGMTFFYVNHSLGAQAGDPTCKAESGKVCTGVGGPGYVLPIEQTSEKHEQWAVAALSLGEGTSDVHGSQFRILFGADPRLDGKETVFGKVISGQEILQAIPDFEACSIAPAGSTTCAPDMSSALVIETVTVKPA